MTQDCISLTAMKFHTCVGPRTSGVNPPTRSAARGSSSVAKMMSQRWMSARMMKGTSQSTMRASRLSHPCQSTATTSRSR